MPVSRPPLGAGIVFGVVPDLDDTQTGTSFSLLCEVLSRRSGQRILPRRCRSPLELAQALGAGEIQLAWVSPTLLLSASALARAVPVACSMRQGLTAFHGVAFVREASPIVSVLDLKGKRAAWVAPTSAAGYFFPRMTLAGRGIDPTTFFASESFYHSHGNVAAAVLGGEADVGAVYAVFENGDPTRRLLRAPFLEREPNTPTARILFATDPIPSDLIVATASLSTETSAAIAAALKTLHEDPHAQAPLVHIFGAEAFVSHDPTSFATLREQVAYGRELGLLE
jgi:phosphonate transport system substrate-binding protein